MIITGIKNLQERWDDNMTKQDAIKKYKSIIKALNREMKALTKRLNYYIQNYEASIDD
jgi:hypothetical protein